jgi:hypothetical protein
MVSELGQHRHQMPTSEDEHPIQHLTPHRADPSLRIGVGPRRSHRRDKHLDRLGGKDPIERGGELGIPIADQESESAEVVADRH